MRTENPVGRILIIVQNLPVPLDRRVWLECQALRDEGYAVSVICPKGIGDPVHEVYEGVHLYKYEPAPPSTGAVGYAREFALSWLRTARLSLRVRREVGFDVIQACNPPDTYFALAAIYKRLQPLKFVYDQHDLNPEVFLSRFGKPKGLAQRAQYAVLQWLERRTFRTADHVISTNESYRAIALDRGGVDAENVTIVRSGPDTSKMRPVYVDGDHHRGRRFLAVYLGIMGPQDGVDVVLRAAHRLVHLQGRRDISFALLGFGDSLESLKALSTELQLDDYVTFTGQADPGMISDYLSAADVALSPDPMSPLNDVSTMNKTMEYMAHAVPVVAFDLKETSVTAGEAAILVNHRDENGFADAVARLLDDTDGRVALAIAGRKHAAAVLDWEPQRAKYVAAYNRLFDRAETVRAQVWPHTDRRQSDVTPLVLTDDRGRMMVDLRRDAELEGFLRQRDASVVDVA